MSEEELELYHKHFEVEPFFYTQAESDAWKLAKKREKMLRNEQRRLLRDEREMREVEEAYVIMSDPEY